ncbi:MAG: hypothetical protein KIT31_05310 [Deltaproteobacteria bacterium]|nr:hypothetical protein [Deltaproteobacteria bacterium]
MLGDLQSRPKPFQGMLDDCEQGTSYNYHIADTVDEHAALSLDVLDRIATATARKVDEQGLVSEMAIALTGTSAGRGDAIEIVRDVALDGLYEWIDEKIDSRNVMMGLLIKYKQRTEWFRRRRLREIATHGIEKQSGGERALAVDLQEYVFDQGVDFAIEPASASGEPDLVLRDSDGSHVIMDPKYIANGAPPSEFKRKLAGGFHQVARYCHDFNEPAGYLIVYIEDNKTPRLELDTADGFGFISINGKQVYYVPVHIADAPPASKAGTAEEVVISKIDLIKEHVPGLGP